MAVVAAVLAVVSVAASVIGGVMAKSAADVEALSIKEQTLVAEQESQEEAKRIGVEGRKFQAKQSLAFIKSGVTISGSSLLVLEETRKETAKEVFAETRRGANLRRLGFQQADLVRAGGRASLIGGVAQGASTASSTIFAGKTAGLFGSKK